MGEETKKIQQSIRNLTVNSSALLAAAFLFFLAEVVIGFAPKVSLFGLYISLGVVVWQERQVAKTLLGAIEKLAQSTHN